jgi:divalent metal cation (Fe/Co/Zn/Cd) transporter
LNFVEQFILHLKKKSSLPEDMLLKEAHNIGETLQNKLEALPEVERAYVHLDFECSHKPEHDGGAFMV